jgi:prepilin-type N-terminal cleavage/methylation domain-containing protein
MEPREGGFALIEVLVAMLIAAIMAVGLVQTLAVAQAARRTGELWMRATQLAVEQMERARGGGCPASSEEIDRFRRECVVEAVAGYPGLRRVTVVVSWPDRAPRRFNLTGLLPAIP